MDIVSIGGFLLNILFVAVTAYISYQNSRKHKVSWEAMAKFNNLNFTLDDSRQGQSSITGKYRSYDLELVGSYGKNKVSTRIVLTKKWQNKPFRKKEYLDQQVTPEDIISRFPFNTRYPLRGKIEVTSGGHQVSYEQNYLETDIEYLKYLFDLLADLADAYPKIIALGGQAVPFIQKHTKLAIIKGNNGLRPIAVQLLKDIAQDTMTRLGNQSPYPLCSYCLARCGPHQVSLSWRDTLTYYGCRLCSQSQNFIEWARPVIAILDNEMATVLFEMDEVLYINWLARRALFDFEAVEIRQATDEEVEWFAMQVGNDTDQLRRARYQEMSCTVLPACNLSPNTLRILRRTFGTVDKL